jgi:hypothetical protein
MHRCIAVNGVPIVDFSRLRVQSEYTWEGTCRINALISTSERYCGGMESTGSRFIFGSDFCRSTANAAYGDISSVHA